MKSKIKNKFINFFYYRPLLMFKGNTTAIFYFLNKKIKVNSVKNFIQLKNEIFDCKIYKFNVASKKPIIIDCGANIGLSVLFFKKEFPGAIVYAFEPDNNNFQLLSYNVKSYELKDVTVYEEAIWINNETISFVMNNDVSSKIDASNKGVVVKARRLKDFISDLDHIDMLKIDIEGAERFVMKDIQTVLYKVSNLFLEYHSVSGEPQELDELLKILRDNNFTYYIDNVFSDKFKLNKIPFVDRNTSNGFNMQLNIFAYKS